MIIPLIILSIIGFCVSLYTYVVEQKIKTSPDFKPVCDISDQISCTKPMKSEYANILFISNAIVGMLFYVVVGILAFLNSLKLLLVVSIIGVIASLILGYILYFKVKSLCLLCTTLYIINFLILVIVVLKLYR